MNVKIIRIGNRAFLQIDSLLVPVDSIRTIILNTIDWEDGEPQRDEDGNIIRGVGIDWTGRPRRDGWDMFLENEEAAAFRVLLEHRS